MQTKPSIIEGHLPKDDSFRIKRLNIPLQGPRFPSVYTLHPTLGILSRAQRRFCLTQEDMEGHVSSSSPHWWSIDLIVSHLETYEIQLEPIEPKLGFGDVLKHLQGIPSSRFRPSPSFSAHDASKLELESTPHWLHELQDKLSNN